jgi:hypothetical protein
MVTTIRVVYRANMFIIEGLMFKSIYISHIRLGHKPEFSRIIVHMIGVKVRVIVGGIELGVKERPKVN